MMKEVGYTDFRLGLPGNLNKDYTSHDPRYVISISRFMKTVEQPGVTFTLPFMRFTR